MERYAIGVDFGTLSARAILIDEKGKQLAEYTMDYPHGVLDSTLPGGKKLGMDWALQVPNDYVAALVETVKQCVEKSGVDKTLVAGIGIDFTSCSVMPVMEDGTPLCNLPQYQNEPHAYPKLWKHHAAQYCADHFNQVATERQEKWLPLYGGRISSEWLIPKAMQIAKEAPGVYRAMDYFIECGDWVIWQMCGAQVRSACNAGYKAQWRDNEGYPSKEFFKALDDSMENFVAEKLSLDIAPVGTRAGCLTGEMAAKMGLTTKTAVAVGIIDAHASVPACGIASEGKMLMAMGTSTCHLLLSREERAVPGVCGVVKGGIVPGLYAYEAGQSCVGDHFSWFIENCVTAEYKNEADKKGTDMFRFLQEKASLKNPGESGLLALDWWNGARSTLMNFDLSGVLIGMTLATKPEDIYRALIEATAYGTRNIIEAFEAGGVEVQALYAGGGIARKDAMTMQIYADVCNREIHIAASEQNAALGAAILGLAAGSAGKSMAELVAHIGNTDSTIYYPIAENAAVYEQLFEEYMTLHDYFGKGGNDVLLRLKQLRTKQMG